MEFTAKIDKKRYACITPNIRSENVVLTDNQREHIIRRRGQEFFEQFYPYFAEIAQEPDYIFQDKRHENTAISCKTLEISGKHVHLVIRLAVEENEKGLENSIITVLIENDKRYRQRLRNNTPLYKRE